MTSRDFAERVQRRAKKAGVGVDAELLAGLEAYFRLLESWNRKINLTALDLQSGSDEMIDRLIVESLVAAQYIPDDAAEVIDIGSGGGSPAIPMHLCRPSLAFTLVEVKTRKSAFLREAGRHLKLNLHVETARFETLLSVPELHDRFSVCTMRAVRVEPKVLVALQTFVREEGQVFLFRGRTGADIPAIIAPPLRWGATYPLVDSQQSRLVILKKQQT